jgi:SAM-dependent methyltransferase
MGSPSFSARSGEQSPIERFRGIVASYDEGAADYSALGGATARDWFAEPQQRFKAALPGGSQVLDLGCGPGLEMPDLRGLGLRPAGLDPSRQMLQFAGQRNPGSPLVQGTVLALPFADGAFDGAWAAASLHHVTRDEAPAALAEIARIVRPGGAFYASVQRGEVEGWVRGQLTGRDTWYTYHTESGWRALIEAAGFTLSWFLATDDVASANEGATGWINTLAIRV